MLAMIDLWFLSIVLLYFFVLVAFASLGLWHQRIPVFRQLWILYESIADDSICFSRHCGDIGRQSEKVPEKPDSGANTICSVTVSSAYSLNAGVCKKMLVAFHLIPILNDAVNRLSRRAINVFLLSLVGCCLFGIALNQGGSFDLGAIVSSLSPFPILFLALYSFVEYVILERQIRRVL